MARVRLILIVLIAHFLRSNSEHFRVVYEWFKLDFSWPDDKTKSEAYLQGHYIPENNIIRSVRIWRDRAFLTLPRSRPGVPVTLATISILPRGGSASPRMDPYPSWDYQNIEDCKNMQNVQSVETDPNGNIWVIDAGSISDVTIDRNCKPKLLVFDIENREMKFKTEFTNLAEDAVLGDIVLDPRNFKTAYISVSTKVESFILVYTKTFMHIVSGLPTFENKQIAVNGTNIYLNNKLAVALSLTENKLYFSPSSSSNLYSVKLSDLTAYRNISDIFQNLGNKTGLSSGMIVDSKENLYFGLVEKDSIVKCSIKFGVLTEFETFKNEAFMQWCDSFAFDETGSIWAVTNRYQTYLDNSVNTGIPNFRLIQAYTGSKSYLYGNYSNLLSSSAPKSLCSVFVLFTVCVLL